VWQRGREKEKGASKRAGGDLGRLLEAADVRDYIVTRASFSSPFGLVIERGGRKNRATKIREIERRFGLRTKMVEV
jgi:hypothetical protein